MSSAWIETAIGRGEALSLKQAGLWKSLAQDIDEEIRMFAFCMVTYRIALLEDKDAQEVCLDFWGNPGDWTLRITDHTEDIVKAGKPVQIMNKKNGMVHAIPWSYFVDSANYIRDEKLKFEYEVDKRKRVG